MEKVQRTGKMHRRRALPRRQ